MTSFNQTLRIRGTKLNVSDTYVDVQLAEYSMSGHVRLVEDVGTSPREWEVTTSKLNEWQTQGNLAQKVDLVEPDSAVWSLIEDLESHIGDDDLASVEGKLRDLVDNLYELTTRGQQNAQGQQ